MPVTVQWDTDAPITGQPDAGSAQKVYAAAGAGTVTVTDEAVGGPSILLNYTVPLGLTSVEPVPAEVDSAGDQVARTTTVAGENFPASASGTVAIATGAPESYGTTVVSSPATTNASGVFSGVALTVPVDLDAGDYHIEATFGDIADLQAALTVVNTELVAPTNLASPAQTANSVDLTWDAVADAEAYVVRWAPTGTTEWTERPAVTGTSDTVAGLTASTEYDFEVKSQAAGSTDSAWSATFTQSTGAPQQLDAPTNLTPGTTTTNTVPLTWDAVTDAQAYTVGWRELGGAWTDISDITDPTHDVTGLDADTEYEFRVMASADGFTDSPWSAIASASTQPLGTLTAPTAASGTVTATSVEITWGQVTDAEQYIVRWDESGQTDWTEEAPVTTLSDVVEGLTTSQAYDFQVKAQAVGWTDSPWSTTVTETPA